MSDHTKQTVSTCDLCGQPVRVSTDPADGTSCYLPRQSQQDAELIARLRQQVKELQAQAERRRRFAT